MAYRNPEEDRARDRERFRRRTAERIAQGLCPKCGKAPPEPERRLCAPCAEKRRAAERVRDAKRRAAGKPRYRNPEKERARDRERSRRRSAECFARGLCPKCGKAPLAPDHTLCRRCIEKRRAAERARYREGQGCGQALWRARPGGAAAQRARQDQATLRRPP